MYSLIVLIVSLPEITMNSFFLVMIRDTQVWCDHFVLISPERYNVIIKLLAHIAMAVFPNVNGLLLVWGGGGGAGERVHGHYVLCAVFT